jgi:hypothetical protein
VDLRGHRRGERRDPRPLERRDFGDRSVSIAYVRATLFVGALACGASACTMPKRLTSSVGSGDNIIAGYRYPPGVLSPPGASGQTEIDGMWPTLEDDPFCCWLGPNASVIANKSVVANRVIIRVFLPPFPYFMSHVQTVAVTIAGQTTTFVGLKPGVHTLTVALDPATARAQGPLRIGLRSATTFSPLVEKMSSDDRRLAIVLTAIAFPTY